MKELENGKIIFCKCLYWKYNHLKNTYSSKHQNKSGNLETISKECLSQKVALFGHKAILSYLAKMSFLWAKYPLYMWTHCMRPHTQCSTDHSTFLAGNTESKITSTFWHNVLTPRYCCRYLQETRTPTLWTLMNWVMNLSQDSCGFILWNTRMICVLEWSCTAV